MASVKIEFTKEKGLVETKLPALDGVEIPVEATFKMPIVFDDGVVFNGTVSGSINSDDNTDLPDEYDALTITHLTSSTIETDSITAENISATYGTKTVYGPFTVTGSQGDTYQSEMFPTFNSGYFSHIAIRSVTAPEGGECTVKVVTKVDKNNITTVQAVTVSELTDENYFMSLPSMTNLTEANLMSYVEFVVGAEVSNTPELQVSLLFVESSGPSF